MKDYLKLAAIVSIFLLGSASDTFANPYGHNQQQQFQRDVQRNRDLNYRHRESYQRMVDRDQAELRHQQQVQQQDEMIQLQRQQNRILEQQHYGYGGY